MVLNSIGRRGVGTREQRRRWWLHRLETLAICVFPLCGTLAPCCIDTAWLVWCSHVDCAWHLLCGARIQSHLARGQLRLRPTTIRVVPSCTWVASLLVRHDRRRGFGQVSASLHTSLCTPLACKPVCALMLTVCSGWLAGRMVRAHYGLPCLGAVLHSLRVIVHPCISFLLECLCVVQ